MTKPPRFLKPWRFEIGGLKRFLKPWRFENKIKKNYEIN